MPLGGAAAQTPFWRCMSFLALHVAPLALHVAQWRCGTRNMQCQKAISALLALRGNANDLSYDVRVLLIVFLIFDPRVIRYHDCLGISYGLAHLDGALDVYIVKSCSSMPPRCTANPFPRLSCVVHMFSHMILWFPNIFPRIACIFP